MIDELFQKYLRDRDARTYGRLMRRCRPLAYSVCRRYLRDPADVEDALQETFLKLAQDPAAVRGSLSGWLCSAAHTTSIDLIRRNVSERRRREVLARASSPTAQEHRILHEAIRQRLHEAMLCLDEASRELIVARFYRKEPLRLIAVRSGASIPTMSRRVRQALADLAAILRDIGITSADDITIAEHFGIAEGYADTDQGDRMRFAADWRNAVAHDRPVAGLSAASAPAWNRPIRVGVFVSYQSLSVVGRLGLHHLLEDPVWSTQWLCGRGFDLVTIAEVSSVERGPVERTMREFELTAGLIDSTDVEALKTLDVILLGLNWAISPAEAGALVEAVRGGVGLLNEYWTGDCSRWHIESQDVITLSLGRPPGFAFHMPHCTQHVPAIVRQEHPLLPGLRTGTQLMVSGCGPIYRPTQDATVPLTREIPTGSSAVRDLPFRPLPMPVFLVGKIGAGRVVVSNVYRQLQIVQHLSVDEGEYVSNVLRWLAEPRREVAVIS